MISTRCLRRARIVGLRFLYSTEARVYSDRWLPRVASGDPTSKLCDPALCFSLRWPVQVVFFRLNYHPDFYSSLKSLYVHQVIENHLTELKNFIDLFICLSVPLHTSITYCAHNRPIHEFLDSNSTHVLNLCSSLFTDLPVHSYTLYASYMLHSTC